MNPKHFGILSLDSPKVVGTATDPDTLDRLCAKPRGECDIVEFRIDKLMAGGGASLPGILKWASDAQAGDLPTLATIRLGKDGGDWNESEEKRLPLFEAVQTGFTCVDIEHDSKLAHELTHRAMDLGKPIILSHHEFSGTPPFDELARIVDRSLGHSHAIAKIATLVRDETDLAILRRLVDTYAGITPLCVIGMGEAAAHTRWQFPLLGCKLTYGFLDGSCAPGQLPARELLARLQR